MGSKTGPRSPPGRRTRGRLRHGIIWRRAVGSTGSTHRRDRMAPILGVGAITSPPHACRVGRTDIPPAHQYSVYASCRRGDGERLEAVFRLLLLRPIRVWPPFLACEIQDTFSFVPKKK